MAAYQWFYSGGQGQFPEIYMTPFYNGTTNKAQGLSFKHISNTNAAYRLYIRERWNRDTIKLTWNKGEKPWWK